MFSLSFKFDENIKSKLPGMMKNLKTKLFDIPTGRLNQIDEAYDQLYFNWIVDFSPDNVINTAWRKEEFWILHYLMKEMSTINFSIR